MDLMGWGTSAQAFAVTFNGAPAVISSIVNTNNQNWLLLGSPSMGTVSVGINGASLTAGTYSAPVTINTPSGSVTVTVNLSVGQGSTGLVATPNPLTVNVGVGAGSMTQNVSVTNNGTP